MFAYNMRGKNGVISGKNLIIIDNDNNKWFQSYDKIVANYIALTDEFNILDDFLTPATMRFLLVFIKVCTHKELHSFTEVKELPNVNFVKSL